MPDDEPLDDARQVAMAAATAAARVAETVAREARDQTARHRASFERAQDQQRAQDALSGLTKVYDTAEARASRDGAREAAGVPADARQVRATADLMNGTNPALAAAQGKAANPARKTQVAAHAREVTHGR